MGPYGNADCRKLGWSPQVGSVKAACAYVSRAHRTTVEENMLPTMAASLTYA